MLTLTIIQEWILMMVLSYKIKRKRQRHIMFLHMGALKAEFSDIPKPTPSIPIAQAELEEFKAGQAYDLSSLKKQKLQYDYLIYREWEGTKEESNIRTIKREGYWAKLTVPEGHIYQLSASSSYNVMKHDLAWDVYGKICMARCPNNTNWQKEPIIYIAITPL